MFKLIKRNNLLVLAEGEIKAGEMVVGEYETKEQLRDRLSELSGTFSQEDRSLVFGGVIKALDDNGNVGGYAALFTGPEDPDITGEFFTKATDFYLDGESKPVTIFHHGLDPTIKSRRLGLTGRVTEIKADDVGIFVKMNLRKRDKYEKAILKMIDDKKLGFSTGSVPHLVHREEVKGHDGVFEIKSWPMVEVSITPTPIEPRTNVISLKSYIGDLDDYDDRSTELKALWTTKYRNDLPDSSFAYIESGGTKDSGGKTKPRRLRHFPYKSADGKPDEAHVRDALGRIPQSTVSDAGKKSALRKIKAAARELGIELAPNKSLSDRLNQFISDSIDDGVNRDDTIKAVASEAMTDVDVVEAVLAGNERASNAMLKAFSRVLGRDYELLKQLNPRREVLTVKGIFEDELASEQYRTWDLWNALCAIVKKLVDAKVGNDIAGVEFDYEAKVKEAVAEYSTRLEEVILQQAADFLEEVASGSDTSFYLRALGDPTAEDFVSAKGVDLDDHLAVAVSAVTSVEKRVRSNYEGRASQKAGRTLSKATHSKFAGYITQLEDHVKRGKAMLSEMMPRVKNKAAIRAIEVDIIRREVEMRDAERGTDDNDQE